MPIPLYPTIDSAWARILERGWGLATDETYAKELIVVSAGRDADNLVHFRAWYVGAKLLEQNQETQRITEADGAKFTRLQPVIDSLLQAQRQYDEANALTIPTGYEATPIDRDRCGGAQAVEVRRPRQVRTVLR